MQQKPETGQRSVNAILPNGEIDAEVFSDFLPWVDCLVWHGGLHAFAILEPAPHSDRAVYPDPDSPAADDHTRLALAKRDSGHAEPPDPCPGDILSTHGQAARSCYTGTAAQFLCGWATPGFD